MPREKFQTLTEPMFYTLLCLHRPAYGAEIMEQVAALDRRRSTAWGRARCTTCWRSSTQPGLITESDRAGAGGAPTA